MTIQEFEKLTGIRPNAIYFENVIHPEYMAAGDDVDKETFCKRWKRNGGLYRMFLAMEDTRVKVVEELGKRIESQDKQIQALQKDVNRYASEAAEYRTKLVDIRAILNM